MIQAKVNPLNRKARLFALKPVFLFAIFALVLQSTSVLAKMYRWIDDNGKVVYSQQPPPDQRATKEIKPPPPPAVDTKTAREKLDRSLQAQEDRREDRKLAADKSKKAKEQAQEKSKVCQDAKDNLAKLAQGGNRLYKNPEGEYQRLDDKARSDLVKKAQEAIKKACKD